MSQANTKEGDIRPLAGEDLLCADVLLFGCDLDGEFAVRRPTHPRDLVLFVLLYGERKGENVTVRPLSTDRSVRVVAKGKGRPGEVLRIECDGTGRVVANQDANWDWQGSIVGVAEEAFVDGQTVKMRPTMRSSFP